MQAQELAALVEKVCQISIEAGKKITEIYQQDFDVITKTDDSPLTTADLASDKYITTALEKLTPNIPILSEESAKLPFSERSQWETYWLIDPLDGTKSFVQKTGEFCTCIALIHQHKPILGVIHGPIVNKTYYASQDNGAFVEGEKIQVRDLPAEPTVCASRLHASRGLEGYLEKIGTCQLLSMSSALKVCLIAEGKVDLYPRLGLTSEWDTAAAQCILEQAGGQLTTTDMQPMRYNTKDSLLNPHFFAFGKNSKDWSAFL